MKTKASSTAIAEVFWTAFQALPKSEQQAVVRRLVSDEEFRNDLLDIATFKKRQGEPSRPFRDYLADRAKKA